MESRWDGEVKILPAGRAPAEGDSPPRICSTWQTLTGDAGWAGVLAETFLSDPAQAAFLVFEPGTDTLPLIAEAITLLPPEQRWDVTFSTYFTDDFPPGISCAWRCVVAGSAEAKRARLPGALIIELGKDLGKAPESALVAQAQTGAVRSRPAPEPGSAEGGAQPEEPGHVQQSRRAQASATASGRLREQRPDLPIGTLPARLHQGVRAGPPPPPLPLSARQSSLGRSVLWFGLGTAAGIFLTLALGVLANYAGLLQLGHGPKTEGAVDPGIGEQSQPEELVAKPEEKAQSEAEKRKQPKQEQQAHAAKGKTRSVDGYVQLPEPKNDSSTVLNISWDKNNGPSSMRLVPSEQLQKSGEYTQDSNKADRLDLHRRAALGQEAPLAHLKIENGKVTFEWDNVAANRKDAHVFFQDYLLTIKPQDMEVPKAYALRLPIRTAPERTDPSSETQNSSTEARQIYKLKWDNRGRPKSELFLGESEIEWQGQLVFVSSPDPSGLHASAACKMKIDDYWTRDKVEVHLDRKSDQIEVVLAVRRLPQASAHQGKGNNNSQDAKPKIPEIKAELKSLTVYRVIEGLRVDVYSFHGKN
jgi:hypothetical protein